MDSSGVKASRRRFLKRAGPVAAAAVAGMAGCSGLGDAESPDADEVPEGKFLEPTLSDGASRSVEKTGEIRQVDDVTGVTAYTAGTIYEVTDLTERVESKTMGTFSDPLMVFFAAKVNIEGWGAGLATPRRIAENSKGIVERRLNDQGVEETREVEPSEPLPDHSPSHSVEFRGSYNTPGFEQTAELPNGETFPIEIPSQELEIVGMMTVWKQDQGTAVIAGGGYPAENYEASAQSSVTSELGDGIDISVSIDLGLQSESLRRRMIDLAEAVS